MKDLDLEAHLETPEAYAKRLADSRAVAAKIKQSYQGARLKREARAAAEAAKSSEQREQERRESERARAREIEAHKARVAKRAKEILAERLLLVPILERVLPQLPRPRIARAVILHRSIKQPEWTLALRLVSDPDKWDENGLPDLMRPSTPTRGHLKLAQEILSDAWAWDARSSMSALAGFMKSDLPEGLPMTQKKARKALATSL